MPSAAPSALLSGETGPLLVSWRFELRPELADRLLARVRENVGNEAVEIMWGAPGTMLAAHAMHDWTGRRPLGRRVARQRGVSPRDARGGRSLDEPPLRRDFRSLTHRTASWEMSEL